MTEFKLRGGEMALQKLHEATEVTKRWKAESNAASSLFEIAKIRERAAELRSQYEPLNSHFPKREDQELVLEAIWWVVFGAYRDKWDPKKNRGGYGS